MDYTYHYASPLGAVTMACDGERLTGLWFDGQRYFASTLGNAYEERELPVFRQTVRWLDLYFSGRAPDFTPPLLLKTTPFRETVLRLLLQVPYGATVTYGELARRVAAETGAAKPSARAVGGAVGRNPIALIIPCHRVVGADGSLTGYAAGTEKKRRLLTLEQTAQRSLQN